MLRFAILILKIRHVQQVVTKNPLRQQLQQPLRHPHLQPQLRQPLVRIGLSAILTPIHIIFAASLGLMVGQMHVRLNSAILMSMKMIISIMRTTITLILKVFHANLQLPLNAILISSIFGAIAVVGTKGTVRVKIIPMGKCWNTATLLT